MPSWFTVVKLAHCEKLIIASNSNVPLLWRGFWRKQYWWRKAWKTFIYLFCFIFFVLQMVRIPFAVKTCTHTCRGNCLFNSFFNFLYFDIFLCIILILMLCIGVLLKSRHDFRIQRRVKGHHALGRFWVAFFTQRHRSAVSSLVCVKDFQKADAD